jgi:two-component system response regulator LytT
MKIVIVEDEMMIAKRIRRFCENILENRLEAIHHFSTIEDAEDYLDTHEIDLLLLDLNLNNRDGFDLLKNKLAASYHTIVISANAERALEAFEYGVLDFVAKPFKQDRLEKALNRLASNTQVGIGASKFLSIKKYGRIELINTEDIRYIRATGHYCEIILMDGSTQLHDKNLEKLLLILPHHFERVHKSYALTLSQVKALHKYPGSQYELELNNGEIIPLGRTRYAAVKAKFNFD